MGFEFSFTVKDLAAFFALVHMLVFFVAGGGFAWDWYVWRRSFWMVRCGWHRWYALGFFDAKSQSYHPKIVSW